MASFAQVGGQLSLSFINQGFNETLQNVDPKKEDFRKYLERNGIIDALTKGMKLKSVLSRIHR